MNKWLRIVVTFVVLLGGYLGYVAMFDVVAGHVQPDLSVVESFEGLSPRQSKSAKEASELALASLGRHHWSAYTNNRYYNVERGYWMYWQKFERPAEYEGKRIRFYPFAVIWQSDRDKSLKVITGNEAIVDFDQPFNLLKPSSGKPTVQHAQIAGDVEIVDNRGTPDDLTDDLLIQMPYVEFFNESLEIKTDAPVLLVDRDVEVNGTGLLIALHPNEESPGSFPGAETIHLKRNILIKAEDVSDSGILPGVARADQKVADADDQAQSRTPMRLLCDGPMTLHLPLPTLPVPVGPPALPRPTIAEFFRNVVVERGVGVPDQLTGDYLKAILVPAEQIAGTEPDPIAQADGPLRDLTLYEATVEGHAVWLKSEAQGFKGRGNELRYKKPGPDQPDITYYRADEGKQLWLESQEFDDEGQLKNFLTVLTTDATMHGDLEDRRRTTWIARGPGLLEMRASPSHPVSRSASWEDQLEIQAGVPVLGAMPDADNPGEVPRRTYITLKGNPKVDDPEQVVMTSDDSIIVCLKDRAGDQAQAQPTVAARSGASSMPDSYQIEWMKARANVEMTTRRTTTAQADQGSPIPSGPQQKLTARKELNVVFEHQAPPENTSPSAGPPLGPLASEPDPADPPQTRFVAQTEPEAPAAEVDSEEPNLEIEADTVWAKVAMFNGPDGQPAREVRESRLRGMVTMHQDPRAGQEKGLDVEAVALDLINPGEGQVRLHAHGAEGQPAVIRSPEFDIEGPILGLDQASNFAWVDGAGTLKQMADQKALDGLRVSDPAPTSAIKRNDENEGESESSEEKQELVITWGQGMIFHGSYPDERGRTGPGRALFVSKVRAKFGDDLVHCEELEAILDRPISFSEALRRPNQDQDQADNRQDQPTIESVICREKVDLLNVRRDDATKKIIEVNRVIGEQVTFQRSTGKFFVDGVGAVLMTALEGTENNLGLGLDASPTPRNVSQRPSNEENQSAPRALYQTRLDFRHGMNGDLGDAPSGASKGSRTAEFRGDVQVLRAQVPGFNRVLDHDHPPADAVTLNADSLYVESNPANPTAGIAEQRLMKALGSAHASASRKAMQADRITYDSRTGLFYAKGHRQPVLIADQEGAGQPVTSGSGEEVKYNPKSGEWSVYKPGSFQLFQPGSGRRLEPAPPVAPVEEAPEADRPQGRLKLQRGPERQGFTGH